MVIQQQQQQPIIKTQRSEPVTNSYDKSGNLTTNFSSTGLDLQPQPDFWGDMAQIVRRLRPVSARQTGVQQAQAIRTPSPQQQSVLGSTAPNAAGPEKVARYVKLVGMGPQSMPSYVQAEAGEPGAIASGYADTPYYHPESPLYVPPKQQKQQTEG